MIKFNDYKKSNLCHVSEISMSHDKTKWEHEEYNRLKSELIARRTRSGYQRPQDR